MMSSISVFTAATVADWRDSYLHNIIQKNRDLFSPLAIIVLRKMTKGIATLLPSI